MEHAHSAEDERERAARQIRAMGAVNRHLQAQIDAGATAPGRRQHLATGWIEELARSGVQDARLVRASDGTQYVVEGGTRRQISSGIIAAALAHALGAPTEIAESDLERLAEGPPVEVLEGPKGPPFVVVGGRRMAVRGLPLPHPVLGEEAEQFPEGAEVNVAAANVARAYFEAARSGRYQLERFRTSIQRNGLVSTLRKGARRITRRFSQTRR